MFLYRVIKKLRKVWVETLNFKLSFFLNFPLCFDDSMETRKCFSIIHNPRLRKRPRLQIFPKMHVEANECLLNDRRKARGRFAYSAKISHY